jgi:hypothetical protein
MNAHSFFDWNLFAVFINALSSGMKIRIAILLPGTGALLDIAQQDK